jgi:NAD(P)-dependent dehydrogenase (short-subunit alcohol dehydrogenase family)
MAMPPARAAADGPVVLVTGCSAGGIGHTLCLEFAARGCRVIASARRPERMAGLEVAGCTLLALDTADAASIDAAVAKVGPLVARWPCCTLGRERLQCAAAVRRPARRAAPRCALPHSAPSKEQTPRPRSPSVSPLPRCRARPLRRAQVFQEYPGGPDILVNNAGVAMRGPVTVRAPPPPGSLARLALPPSNQRTHPQPWALLTPPPQMPGHPPKRGARPV